MKLRFVHGIPEIIIDSTTAMGFGMDKDLCEGRGVDQLIGENTIMPYYGFHSSTDVYFDDSPQYYSSWQIV